MWNPEFEGKAVSRAAEGYRKRAGEGEQEGAAAVVVGIDFGSRGEGGVGREGTSGGGVGQARVQISLSDLRSTCVGGNAHVG